jgi:T5SS/PEP-CTERM-associated repeat protein
MTLFVATLCGAAVAPAAITPGGDTIVGTLNSSTYVGYGASGTLTLNGGSQLDSYEYGYIGYSAGATGTATVTGLGSSWTTRNGFYVGYLGNGTLNLQSGGGVGSGIGSGIGPIYIGYDQGSTGTVDVTGAGSSFNSASGIYVGHGGTASLTVANGGSATTSTLFASLADLHGNGTITANGAVLDGNLVFNTPVGSGGKTVPFGTGGSLKLTFGTLFGERGSLGVGYRGNGSLLITNGVTVTSNYASYLGYLPGSSGTASVSGAGSRWDNGENNIYVGNLGNGSLRIDGGGQVNTGSYAFIGYDATGTSASSGAAVVTGGGSRWTHTGGLYVGDFASGTLTIEAGGVVNSQGGYLGEGTTTASGTVIVRGAGSKWNNTSQLTLGTYGSGTMKVEDGAVVTSYVGYLAYWSGTHGDITVRGAGSKWTNTTDVYVGHGGNGTLTITNGGLVSNVAGYLAYATPGWSGTARVSGPGSKWSNSGDLSVGVAGTGKLTVADGGAVTARAMSVNDKSTVRLHVSGNGMMTLGNTSNVGSLTNNGTLAFYADAFLPAGVYRPVAEFANRNMTWSGSGTYAPTGGTWNGTAKTLTVTPATALAAGVEDTITSFERLLVTDALSGKRAGASFGAVSGDVQVSASPINAILLDDSIDMPIAGAASDVGAAWEFTSDLPDGNEVLLSFDVGLGLGELTLYHEQDGAWSPFEPALLTYDANGVLSFTVTSLGGYAAVPVPEPAGVAMVAIGAIAAAVLRRRRTVTPRSCRADR